MLKTAELNIDFYNGVAYKNMYISNLNVQTEI